MCDITSRIDQIVCCSIILDDDETSYDKNVHQYTTAKHFCVRQLNSKVLAFNVTLYTWQGVISKLNFLKIVWHFYSGV